MFTALLDGSLLETLQHADWNVVGIGITVYVLGLAVTVVTIRRLNLRF